MGWPELFAWIKGDFEGARFNPMEGGLTGIHSIHDPLAEYRGLTQSVALMPFPQRFLIKAEGPDAADYLHRRLTRSIETLRDGEGAHALQLAGDGRLQCNLLVYRGAGAFWILASRANVQAAYTLTEKYILMDNVTLAEHWKEEGMIVLGGPKAEALLARLAGGPAPQGWTCNLGAAIGSIPCRIFRDCRFGLPWFHISTAHDSLEALARAISEACAADGGGMDGEAAADLFRIERGVPLIGRDIDEKSIPLEADLWDAIDFDKGCFPGQEILARIRNLGHPARQLVRLEIDAEVAPSPEDPIMDETEPIGAVTSARTLPGLGRAAALGYVKWDRRELGSATILSGKGTWAARLSRVEANMLALREAERARKEALK